MDPVEVWRQVSPSVLHWAQPHALSDANFENSIQFHNFVVKLIDRLKKYQSRGIDVLDAPAIAEDKEFRSYSFGFG